MRDEILALLENSGVWFSSQNYYVYTGHDFVLDFGEYFTESEKTLFKNVSRIQRQCDTYAIELLNEILIS